MEVLMFIPEKKKQLFNTSLKFNTLAGHYFSKQLEFLRILKNAMLLGILA